jgi:hypothetical protein
MKLREFPIWLLLRMYPAAWRREFGAEFEELLQRWPLSAPVMVNVIASALSEHVINLFRRISGGGEMAERTFGAHYDRLTKIVSAGAVMLLVAVPVMAMRAGAVAVFVALVSATVIALSFAFSPRGYVISGGEFRVKRLIADVVFPLDELRFVRDATTADFRGCVRLWASGGLFGYYGWFWSKALGRSRWYVTDRSKAVVVADGDQIILVSPEDRDGFVAAIGRRDAGIAAPSTRSAIGGLVVPLIVGLAIGGATLALVASAFLYAPGRPPVDLTRDSLVIHSRFYGMTVPASSVDAANVRVVDLRLEPGWKPVLRTDGFGNPYYRAGNFQTANGRDVKLFTTGTERLVLLPPSREDGTPVLLDAVDPDQFVTQVREEWRGR